MGALCPLLWAWLLLWACFWIAAVGAAPFRIVVLSQPTPLERALASAIQDAFVAAGLPLTHVSLQHEMPQTRGFWTYFPLFHRLAAEGRGDYDWLVLLSPYSSATLELLRDAVAGHLATDRLYFGAAITDGPDHFSIRHHYQRQEYPYPLAGQDLVFSAGLVRDVQRNIRRNQPPEQFHIDAEWELAVYLHDVHRVDLISLPGCRAVPNSDKLTAEALADSLRRPIGPLDIAVGVKTAELFHETRVPEVLETWAADVPQLHFYSNAAHPTVPTVWKGIPDTKSGHCGKTMALLADLYHRYPTGVSWFIVADDDTLLSVPRLLRTLALLDPKSPVFAGERYGYGYPRTVTQDAGFDYMTGGSAMVLSKDALVRLLRCPTCRCRTNDAPDDMTLGVFMRDLGVPAIHLPGMHQAAPSHYHPVLLAGQEHISFHSCRASWQCDFREVYRRFLVAAGE